jgi:hypothetical protein
MMLADQGARVIKVEPPGGENTRRAGPRAEGALGIEQGGFGPYFASVNRNKESIVLDLKTPEGKDALLRLVDKADALSEGRKNPHDILEITKNMSAVRNHLADSLNELYAETTGNERRRNIETVIRAMTDLTRIDDPGDDHAYLRGQLVPMSEIERKNKELRSINKREIRHTPQLKAMNKMPLAGQEDWMARLNFQQLKNTYVEGAAQNWKSDIHGHPIAGIAHGAEFGLEPPGSVKLPNSPGITDRMSNLPKASTPKVSPFQPKPEKQTGFFSFLGRSNG